VTEHISRKDLKKDEVRETLVHGAEAVLSHQKLTTYIAITAAVVLIAIFGWKFYAEQQTKKAVAAFDDALKVFAARIRTPGEPAEPGEITYVDEKNKFDDASKKFVDVAQHFSHTRPGQMAAYYAGLSFERLNRPADAAKWLDQTANSSSEEFSSLGRLELAHLYDKGGKAADALKLYQDVLAHPSDFVPKPVAMMALADHYRETNNSAEALKLYAQIKSEFPDTQMATEAGQQLALLPAKP